VLTVEQGNEQVLQNIIESFRGKKGITISLLSKIQDTFGYLPQEAMSKVARELDISEASLYGVPPSTLCFGLTLPENTPSSFAGVRHATFKDLFSSLKR